MGTVESVNVGAARPVGAGSAMTGIDKRPVLGPVAVAAPGPKGLGGSGLTGDVIVDRRHHGGDTQAVYAYAREDLDAWGAQLGEVRSGAFGENVTTLGIDVTETLIGERWRIGDDLVLEATAPRIPCANFAAWMDERGWLRLFTRRARPGAYLRVIAPGPLEVGDDIAIESRPDHGVTIGLMFRALTLEPRLLPQLLRASEFLSPAIRARAAEHQPDEPPSGADR